MFSVDLEILRAKLSIAENQAIIDARNLELRADILLSQAKDFRQQANLLHDAYFQSFHLEDGDFLG